MRKQIVASEVLMGVALVIFAPLWMSLPILVGVVGYQLYQRRKGSQL